MSERDTTEPRTDPETSQSNDRTLVAALSPGETATVRGWLSTVAADGSRATLRDRTGAVHLAPADGTDGDSLSGLTPESVVAVTGVVAADDVDDLLVRVERVEVLNPAADLPFRPASDPAPGRAERFDSRMLDLRRPPVRAVFRLRDAVLEAFQRTLRRFDAVEVDTPMLVAVPTEADSDAIPVEYFDHDAVLRQSTRLHCELAAGSDLERVFEVGTVFRSPPPDAPFRLVEATVAAFEGAFLDADGAMVALETAIREADAAVADADDADLDALGIEPDVATTPFDRITYEECLSVAAETPDVDEPDWGERLPRAAMRAVEASAGGPVFVTDAPAERAPFHARRDGDTAETFALVRSGLEVASGARRERRRDRLDENLREAGLEPADFGFYLDALDQGFPPSAGWAIGVERLLAVTLDLDDVREASLFPRDRSRLSP